MAQFDIYKNPGSKAKEVPFLVSVQNDHITSRTGATVVIPLRVNMTPVETLAPVMHVSGFGACVLSTDELFAIDTALLKKSIAALSAEDRAKIRPALDKVFGDY